jgi:5-(aminomethyl)-3-furanmethanol phosphate kinase
LQPARSESEIAAVAREGSTPVWLPLDLLREGPDELTTWDVTSDSLALWLANRLNAERLVVVKSCAIDPELSLAQLSEQGVLDRRFATMAASATMPIQVLEHTALAEVSVQLSSASS